MNIGECHLQGGDICCLIKNQNSLIAAVKNLAAMPFNSNDRAALVRSSMAIVESIMQTKNCPSCGAIGVVRDGNVKLHFSSPQQIRPCPASHEDVLGGFIVLRESR